MGRPTKITAARIDALIEGLQAGLPITKACPRAGIEYSGFRRWMIRGETETEGLYAELVRQVNEVMPPVPSVASVAAKDRQEFLFRAHGGETYTERLLMLVIVTRLPDLLRELGLQEAKSVLHGNQLKNGFRPDILVEHVDGTWTIFEVKSRGGNRQKRYWTLYGAIGQLLYYLEMFTDEGAVSSERVRLVLLFDCEIDEYLRRAMRRTTPSILFYNVSPLLLGDFDGSAHEVNDRNQEQVDSGD